MAVIRIPVGSVVGVHPAGVGEAEGNRQGLLRFHARGEQVLAFTPADGLHLDGEAFPTEGGMQHAVPHIQGLVHLVDLVRAHPLETDVAEVKAVGVGANPGGCGLAAGRLGIAHLHGIDAVRMPGQWMVLEGFLETEIFGVGEGVPTPLAVGAQRQAVLAELGEGLQARGVERQSEAAVAEVERVQRGKRIDVGIVARHQRFAVDLSRLAGSEDQDGKCQEESQSLHFHGRRAICRC